MKEHKIRLKGHETFMLREGWLTKGLLAVEKNRKVFLEHAGADELGVGTNMAKALRYWLREGRFIKEQGKEGAVLTKIAKIIAAYDPYFEDNLSLWLFHIGIVSNPDKATSWYVFFHLMESGEFTKEELFREMKEKLMTYGGTREISERSLWDDCMVLLQMYCPQREYTYDPEDKRISPFAHLGLIKRSGNRYQKSQPDGAVLDAFVILYLIQGYFKEAKQDFISIDQLLSGDVLPGKMMNLTRVVLNQYLDELADEGYIMVNRTAGLDMVYQNHFCTKEEVALLYYKKRRQDVPAKRTS